MSDELRARPARSRKLAAAVTLYHVVIEATLAQPGQHFITSYLTDRDLLPGFREGMENVAADEQRHIGFGVKLLSDLRKMDPEVPDAVADLLREVIPYTASVLIPPDWDMRYIECFGFTLEDIGEEGASSLETKMRSAGMPIEELPGPPVFPVPGTPRERAERGHKMVRAGLPGREGRPAVEGPGRHAAPLRDDRRRPGLSAAAEPGVIQWDFRDAEPWHVVVANGATRAEPGRSASARVTLKLELRGLRRRGRRPHATRASWCCAARLRPRGDLRWLWRSRRMFPA